MKITAVAYEEKTPVKREEEKKYALRQLNKFVRLVEILPNGAELDIIEIVGRLEKPVLLICPGAPETITNYSKREIKIG